MECVSSEGGWMNRRSFVGKLATIPLAPSFAYAEGRRIKLIQRGIFLLLLTGVG